MSWSSTHRFRCRRNDHAVSVDRKNAGAMMLRSPDHCELSKRTDEHWKNDSDVDECRHKYCIDRSLRTSWCLTVEMTWFPINSEVFLSSSYQDLLLFLCVTSHRRCFSFDPGRPSTLVSGRTRCSAWHTWTNSMLLPRRPPRTRDCHWFPGNCAIAVCHGHWPGRNDVDHSSTFASYKPYFQLKHEKRAVDRVSSPIREAYHTALRYWHESIPVNMPLKDEENSFRSRR